MSHHLVNSTAVTDIQHAMASTNIEGATEPSDPSVAVFDIPELLVMVLSNLNIKDLSRTLSVSKQWNSTILDTPQFRRTLFLEAVPPKEYMRFMTGTDQRFYEIPHSLQPVMVRAPLVESEAFEGVTRVVVDPHPALSGSLSGRHTGSSNMDIDINLPNYAVLAGVPASALLFQPPLDHVTIGYCARHIQIRIPGGVTFGDVLREIEKTQTAAKEAMVRSPRFGGYLFRVADRLSLSIRVNGAFVNDTHYAKVARMALRGPEALRMPPSYGGNMNGSVPCGSRGSSNRMSIFRRPADSWRALSTESGRRLASGAVLMTVSDVAVTRAVQAVEQFDIDKDNMLPEVFERNMALRRYMKRYIGD